MSKHLAVKGCDSVDVMLLAQSALPCQKSPVEPLRYNSQSQVGCGGKYKYCTLIRE